MVQLGYCFQFQVLGNLWVITFYHRSVQNETGIVKQAFSQKSCCADLTTYVLQRAWKQNEEKQFWESNRLLQNCPLGSWNKSASGNSFADISECDPSCTSRHTTDWQPVTECDRVTGDTECNVKLLRHFLPLYAPKTIGCAVFTFCMENYLCHFSPSLSAAWRYCKVQSWQAGYVGKCWSLLLGMGDLNYRGFIHVGCSPVPFRENFRAVRKACPKDDGGRFRQQCFSLLFSLHNFTESHDFSLNIGTKNSWQSMWSDWKEQQFSYRKVSSGAGESLNSDLRPRQGKAFLHSLLHCCTFAADKKVRLGTNSASRLCGESQCLLQMLTSSVLILCQEEPWDSVSLGKGGMCTWKLSWAGWAHDLAAFWDLANLLERGLVCEWCCTVEGEKMSEADFIPAFRDRQRGMRFHLGLGFFPFHF